jgi:hypothetical protein
MKRMVDLILVAAQLLKYCPFALRGKKRAVAVAGLNWMNRGSSQVELFVQAMVINFIIVMDSHALR